MARQPNREAVYEVADLFRQRCLVESKSLLWPDCDVWTLENLDRLWNAFVEHPDEGKESFVDKFRKQLAAEPVDVYRIAVDLAVVYCLFPSAGSGGMGGQAKINLIESIRSASLANASPDQSTWENVYQAIQHGIGSPGANCLNERPFHYAFYLQFSRQIVFLGTDIFESSGCERIADDAVVEIKSKTNLTPRLSRNMILHLLFPDEYERIASPSHKSLIHKRYKEEAGVSEGLTEDQGILLIRKHLDAEWQVGFDFYEPDLFRCGHCPTWIMVS